MELPSALTNDVIWAFSWT